MATKKTTESPLKVETKTFLDSAKSKTTELLHEGNTRHFTIKSKSGQMVLDLPLLLAIVIAVFIPYVVAAGIILALILGCSLSVDKK